MVTKLIARTQSRLLLKLRKTIQQCGHITAAYRVFDIFSPFRGDNEVINQVERLSSNETKIAQDQCG